MSIWPNLYVEKYGYNAVLQALAEIGEVSPDEILSSKDKRDGEAHTEAITSKFASLASQWTQAVAGMSSTVEMAKHPANPINHQYGESCILFC